MKTIAPALYYRGLKHEFMRAHIHAVGLCTSNSCQGLAGHEVLGSQPRFFPVIPDVANVYRDVKECRKREGRPEDLAAPFSVPAIDMNTFLFVHEALPKEAEGSLRDSRNPP